MASKIHRKFIAGVTSLALCVTAIGAGPVQAEQKRNYAVEQTIAAILGLAVVGAIIADKKGEKRHKAAPVHPVHPVQPVHPVHPVQPVTRNHAPAIEPRPLPRRANRRALPERCLRTFNTFDGRARIFGQSCMERHYARVDRLPLRCERRVRTDRGVRQGWGARCLRREGYFIAGR